MSVTQLDITTRRPRLDGKRFGAAGSYACLGGTVTFAADPVTWSADFCLPQPADAARTAQRYDLVHTAASAG